MVKLQDVKNVHLIGIGGIGMSAIAKMFLEIGKKVSGSDNSQSLITDELKSLGVFIFVGQKAENVPADCDLIVYTNALSQENSELVEAKKRGIKTLSYPEVLGEISKDKFTIAVSGNAGKTTTTGMLGQVLIDAGLEPTIIVGSLVNFVIDGKTVKTNFVFGKGKYFVVEADEYKRAFLNLSPSILAINNIEADHLDYYKDLADIQKAFSDLVSKVPESGFIVCSAEDPKVSPVLQESKATILNYPDISIEGFNLSLPGDHNRENAKVVVTIAGALGVEKEIIKKSLENFKGAWRRFEFKGETSKGALVYDDYAHNPKKVGALIQSAKEKFQDKKVAVVFEPHLFSRTKTQLKDFAEVLSGAEKVFLAPIYPAREVFDSTISSEMLRDEINKKAPVASSFKDLKSIKNVVLEETDSSWAILVVGAGDIYKLAPDLIS